MSDRTEDHRIAQLSARVEQLAVTLSETEQRLRGAERRRVAASALGAALAISVGMGVTGFGLSAQTNPIQRGRFMTPFEVVDPGGRTVLSVEVGAGGTGFVTIGNPNTGGVTFGVGKSGAGYAIVRGATGGAAASIGQLDAGPMALRVASADGKGTVASLGVDSSGHGLLHVGRDGAGGVVAGDGASGYGFVEVRNPKGQSAITMGQRQGRPLSVSVFDAAGNQAITELGADASGSGQLVVRRTDTKSVASLGPSGDLSLALSIGTGADPVAALGVRSGRGVLRVGNDDGGGLVAGTDQSGHGFAEIRNAGGDLAIDLSRGSGGAMGIKVFDEGGTTPVAELVRNAGGLGGLLTVGGTGGTPILRVAPSVSPSDARVTIGAGQKGGFALNVTNASKAPVASLGEASIGGGAVAAYNAAGTIGAILSGTGQIHVADSGGKTFATMVAENGQGAFTVRNAAGTTIARLGEAGAGGVLQLANASGNAMVEAGVLPGRGIVRAYPLGSPGMGLIGMPGTFISGLLK